jgi:hypothetical protein
VHYIDDPELAYVMQRCRECHDFYHALCSMPVSVEYKLALKVFEFANLGLLSAALSTAAVVRLDAAKRARFFSEYVPWALRCGSAARAGTEGEEITWCTKKGHGECGIAPNTILGIQVLRNPNYVQFVAFIKQENIQTCVGGELDRWGQDLVRCVLCDVRECPG